MAMQFNIEKCIKRYPHFDGPLSRAEAERLVGNPSAVACHAFFPFIHFKFRVRRYDKESNERKIKTRDIYFAARRDALIFSYYRCLLRDKYEEMLRERGIEQVPIAYRRIKTASGRGKSNIEFAKDAFDFIAANSPCTAIALDIERFFDSLDHKLIKQSWASAFGSAALPCDHFAVYKAVTKFDWVDRDSLYERLGFSIGVAKGAVKQYRFLIPRKKIPMRLCSSAKFREVVRDGGRIDKSFLQSNKMGKGIPQGAPISDVIANLYMLNVDLIMNEFVTQCGGFYRRYSDDILIILPKGKINFDDVYSVLNREIEKLYLNINTNKTQIADFELNGSGKICYLGFDFDGESVTISSKTLVRLNQKIRHHANYVGKKISKKFPDENSDTVVSKIDIGRFIERYARLEDFDPNGSVLRRSFYSYAKRSSEVFGPKGQKILRQISRINKSAKAAIRKAVDKDRENAMALEAKAKE